MTEKTEMVIDKCLNCSTQYAKGQKFCNQCGQKTEGISLRASSILINFWESLVNLENSFFKTIKYIFLPWKLTEFYVQGQRKSFLNPVRFFIFTLIIHFGLFSLSNDFNISQKWSYSQYVTLEKSKMLDEHHKFLSAYESNNDICVYADQLNTILFKDVKLPDENKLALLETNAKINLFGIENYPITIKDAVELSSDSLFTKYKITSFWDKLVVKQFIRLNLDSAGAMKYLIKNIAWGMIPLVISLALIFKLLYIRRKIYLSEHIVLLMNIHSASFVIVSIFLLINYFMQWRFEWEPLVSIAIMALFFVSTWKYYKQSIIKTLFKNIIALFAYSILIVIFLLCTAMLSLMIY
ncbi:MAG: DUF3667 domain-containing protein [Saprospiraceae bacterium]|nr:DUF3667 domain-containing protein [Saprospiraceae bacterium]